MIGDHDPIRLTLAGESRNESSKIQSDFSFISGKIDDIEKAEERVQEAATDDVENTPWLPPRRWTSKLGTGRKIVKFNGGVAKYFQFLKLEEPKKMSKNLLLPPLLKNPMTS